MLWKLAAVDNVTADNWQKCIEHVIKQDQKMWDLDTKVAVIVEPVIINLGYSIKS